MNFSKIYCIVYDFDGVMTDNKALLGINGNEYVSINRSDGLAVSLFKKMGMRQVIITTEKYPLASARAKKLGIDIVQGSEDKGDAVTEYCRANGIDLQSVLYIGNDINDLPAMKKVAMRGAPADAEPEIIAIADWISVKNGGDGVVRDLYRFIYGEGWSDTIKVQCLNCRKPKGNGNEKLRSKFQG